jgi:hypothetical protein
MAVDLVKNYSTSRVATADIGQAIDELKNFSADERKPHERRWYDNNFFDDGYHFRYLRRTDNKIIDLSSRATLWAPMRAIPKASKQLRGVANLLVSNDPIPVVYPEKVYKGAFTNPAEYQQALDEAKRIAKTSGHWLSEEFKKQSLSEKFAHMVILAGKHSVSWLKVWPDAVSESIETAVRDAFDIYTMATVNDADDLPYVIDATPKLISEIKANENFDPNQLAKITPDNKQASSEIKDAYMRNRFGRDRQSDATATLIQKEAFVKEYLNSENRERIAMQEDGGEILQGKKEGDQVLRQTFVAGNIWLRDKYVNLPNHPFVDYRFEPGPMYQVPLIERFIPQNKSYDMLVSRAERFAHTMTTGAWAKKQGEKYNMTNDAGGVQVEYQTTPPQPLVLPSIPGFYFNLMQMIEGNIEEQGVSTSTLNKLPAGVKGYQAIESLKESEYAGLVIPQKRFKGMVKRVAEKFLDIADNHFITPQTVYYMEKGEPQYFDVIGASAMKKRQELQVPVEGEVTPLSKEYYVDIEIQSGMAYTHEGKKAAAKELGDYMLQLAQMGVLPPQVVTIFIQTMLETYQFGPTADVMDAMKENEGQGNLTDQQIDAIKVAVMEVMKDLITQKVLPDEEQRIEENKVAMAEVIKDTGALENETAETQQKMAIAQEDHEQKMTQADQKMEMEQLKAAQEISLKDRQAEEEMEIKRQESRKKMEVQEKTAEIKARQAKKGGQNASSKR